MAGGCHLRERLWLRVKRRHAVVGIGKSQHLQQSVAVGHVEVRWSGS